MKYVKRNTARHTGLAKGWKEKNYLFLAKERTTATSPVNRRVQQGMLSQLQRINQTFIVLAQEKWNCAVGNSDGLQ